MNSFHILALSALLSGIAAAQVAGDAGTPPPKTDKQAPPSDAKPDGTSQEKEPPVQPIDSTKLLENSLEIARRECEYLEKVCNTGGLVTRFRERQKTVDEMIQRYLPEDLGPAMASKRKARLLGDGEKAILADDVVFTVETVPVKQAEFDAMVAYLKGYPQSGDVRVETLAILALVENHAGQGAFAKTAQSARATMDEVMGKAKSGTGFAELAQQFSDDKATAATGGKLDFQVRDTMDKSYAMHAFGLNVGQVSDIVAANDGYHLIRVLGKKAGDTPDKDKIQTAHVVRYYSPDVTTRERLVKRIAAGDIDLAFRKDEMRKLAPTQFQ